MWRLQSDEKVILWVTRSQLKRLAVTEFSSKQDSVAFMQTALVLMTKKIDDKTTTYDLNGQPEKPNISNKNKLSPEIYLNFFNTIIWLQDNRRLKYTLMLPIQNFAILANGFYCDSLQGRKWW